MIHDARIIGAFRGISETTNHIVLPVIAAERLTIGYSKGTVLRLGLDIIDELHAIIYTVRVKDDHFMPFIRDCSKNGTFLNKRLIGRRRSAALFSGCMITFAHPQLQFIYISREIIKGPEDEPFQDAPLLYTEQIKRNYGPWDMIRLPDQLGYIRDKIGGVYLSIPYAPPKGIHALQFACKIIRAPPHPIPGTDNTHARFMTEVEILKQCRHPCIPILVEYGVKQVNKFYFCHMFTPLAAGGTLATLIERSHMAPIPGIPLSKATRIFLQLVEGLHYLHNVGRSRKEVSYYGHGPKSTSSQPFSCFHGDIKPANILVMEDTESPHVVINDFGCARPLMENVYLGDEGTLAYWPLERYDYRRYSIQELQGIDIWSLGVTFYEMIAGSHPFFPPNMGTNMPQMKSEIEQHIPTYTEGYWESYYQEYADFVRTMLEKKLERRATTTKLLKMLYSFSIGETENYHRNARMWEEYAQYRQLLEGNVPECNQFRDLSQHLIDKIQDAGGTFVSYNSARNGGDMCHLSRRDWELLVRISESPSGPSGKNATLPMVLLSGDSVDPDIQMSQDMANGMHLRDAIPSPSPYGADLPNGGSDAG